MELVHGIRSGMSDSEGAGPAVPSANVDETGRLADTSPEDASVGTGLGATNTTFNVPDGISLDPEVESAIAAVSRCSCAAAISP
jgi:hypothetical protein